MPGVYAWNIERRVRRRLEAYRAMADRQGSDPVIGLAGGIAVSEAESVQKVGPGGEIERLVAEAREGGESDYYTGKRHSIRFAAGAMLEATADAKNPDAARWPITMHNVSEGGFGFWSKRPLELQTILYVREFSPDDSRDWLAVRVSHCTLGIRGHLVGVAFVNAS